MQLEDGPVRCKVGVYHRAHGLLSALDSSREGKDAHPADHGVEGEELLNLWFVARNGIAICFRCLDDEVVIEAVSPRHFAGQLPCPRLATLGQPSGKTRGQAADE